MNILADGISVFYEYKAAIIVFLISVLGFGLLATKHVPSWKQTPGIKYIAALSIGSVVLSVITYILIFFSHFWPFLLRPGSYAILFFALFIVLREFHWGEFRIGSHVYSILIAATSLFFLLLIRLAFLKHILLPLYSDSPIHYQIVFGFIHPDFSTNSRLSLETSFSNYYHFGFHSLVAWLVSVTKVSPSDAISLVGQLFLVIGPLSIYFLVSTTTNNSLAALFAALLSAIGWNMPAFAVNWGKFPAISALAVLPSAITFLGLYSYESRLKYSKLFWGGTLLVGITLMHTRILICVLLVAICFLVSKALPARGTANFFQSLRFGLLFLVSLWPLMPMLEDFYNKPFVIFILIILLPFAFERYTSLALGVFLFIFGLWLIVKMPIFLVGNDRSLLDKQFLEIMLYIPISLMGGIGFAGLMNRVSFNPLLQHSLATLFIGGILLSSLQNHAIYPDSCCNYFTENDALAFEWIEENIADHAIFLISSFNNGTQIMGTDAGIWLFPLLEQPTNKLPYNLDWDSGEGFEHICRLDAQKIYIYMGGKSYSFDSNELSTKNWATLVFQSGKTQIYRVAKCL